MSLWYKIALFSIAVNLGAGILMTMLGYMSYDTSMVPIHYNSNMVDGNISISTPNIESNQNWWLRIMDYISVGIFTKVQEFMNTWIYGFTTIFVNMKLLDPAIAIMINSAITIIYFDGAVFLFTGRSLLYG